MIVSVVRVLIRVREDREEPGSLKAIWPSGPIPPINKSIPPISAICFSQFAHSASRSVAFPFRICTFSFLISIWLKKFFHMNVWQLSGWSSGKPTYSSMLKVTTFWKDTFPCLFSSISALYIPSGDEPVGQPSTNGFSGVGFAALILLATQFAAHCDSF